MSRDVRAEATQAEVGEDRHLVAEEIAGMIEDAGLPVCCLRGAYFAPRWAALVCLCMGRYVAQERLVALREDATLRDAALSAFDLGSLDAMRVLIWRALQ